MIDWPMRSATRWPSISSGSSRPRGRGLIEPATARRPSSHGLHRRFLGLRLTGSDDQGGTAQVLELPVVEWELYHLCYPIAAQPGGHAEVDVFDPVLTRYPGAHGQDLPTVVDDRPNGDLGSGGRG